MNEIHPARDEGHGPVSSSGANPQSAAPRPEFLTLSIESAVCGAAELSVSGDKSSPLTLLVKAEDKLHEIARLKPDWNGSITRAEARAVLNELHRLRSDLAQAETELKEHM